MKWKLLSNFKKEEIMQKSEQSRRDKISIKNDNSNNNIRIKKMSNVVNMIFLIYNYSKIIVIINN